MVRSRTILQAAILCVASTAEAEDSNTSFDFFRRHCLSSGPDFDRTVRAAQAHGWTPLRDEVVIGLAPVDDPESIEGWAAQGNGIGQPLFVGVAKNNLGGKSVQACTVATSGVDSRGFERQLFDVFDAEAIDENRSPTHVHKLYSVIVKGRNELVTLTVPAAPDGSDQLMARSIAETQWEN
ncbi:hypothetical protein [Rhizobium sullae]|uniref:Uncharacterized protein n=1 Tax=Rhizobium sullae TaxID=50338 RepID=A0A4V2V7W9_RHISU|nr:hypothetical protein [Rhizobium sullae]TCU06809.1 hypothetical protein EV132_13120 [Rhizobium sullae]